MQPLVSYPAAGANAVGRLVRGLADSGDRQALARIARAARAPARIWRGATEAMADYLAACFALDLVGFLNRAAKADLVAMAAIARVSGEGRAGDLRARLWRWGAVREAGTAHWIGTAVQPAPIVLGEKLVILGPVRGLAPAATRCPRPVPPPVAPPADTGEPDSIEALCARADRLVGVRLGPRGKDKGAFGTRAAALLGVGETGEREPDWRGEVEIKTVPVIRDRSGFWKVSEDPAVGMAGARPLYKLQRVLWLARVADDPSAPILSWYYQELSDELCALIARDLHTRPKGGKRTTARGHYLHKRFFADSGFLRTLNLQHG